MPNGTCDFTSHRTVTIASPSSLTTDNGSLTTNNAWNKPHLPPLHSSPAWKVRVDEWQVQAARKGDRAALAALLRELQDPWFRFSLSLLGDPELAREAAQETGLRFIRTLPNFRGDSQLQTWSLGITLNVVREMRRKNRPVPEDGREFFAATRSIPTSPFAAADFAEQREKLHALLADLPDRQREAVVLRFFEELSVEQTALAMECAEGTVKATVHQALKSLRAKLSPTKPTMKRAGKYAGDNR